MTCLDVLRRSALAFLESIAFPVAVLDEAGVLVWVNPSLCSALDADPEKILGRTAGLTLSEAGRTALLGWIADWRRGDATPRRAQLQSEGRQRVFWLLPHPLRDESGHYVGCVVGVLDERLFQDALLLTFREAGTLLKGVLRDLAGDASRAVAALDGDVREDLRSRIPALAALTEREWAVASRIGRGDRTASVASELGIRVGTVRNHLKAVYRKTGTRSQTQLVERLRLLRRKEASAP